MKVSSVENWLKEALGGFYNPFMIILKVVVIVLVAFLSVKLGSYIIKKIFDKRKKTRIFADEKKINTMATLLLSVFKYAVYLIAGIIILTDVFKLTSVLAAAGVGGIAIGLGAQSLIKDVISGFFIILEDHFAVGDLITVDGMTGTVEQMELRVTKIRNFNGDLYIVPNGEFKTVTNHTRGGKAVLVDIPVAYSSDINKAFEIAGHVCTIVSGEFDIFIEEPRVLGITELGNSCLNLRIFAKTQPNQQWGVERRIRKLIMEKFSEGKIKFYDRNKIVQGDEVNA
jgi:small-conductance mechanosensitive channel